MVVERVLVRRMNIGVEDTGGGGASQQENKYYGTTLLPPYHKSMGYDRKPAKITPVSRPESQKMLNLG